MVNVNLFRDYKKINVIKNAVGKNSLEEYAYTNYFKNNPRAGRQRVKNPKFEASLDELCGKTLSHNKRGKDLKMKYEPLKDHKEADTL